MKIPILLVMAAALLAAADEEDGGCAISVYDSAGRQIALEGHIIRRETGSDNRNILEIGSRTDVDKIPNVGVIHSILNRGARLRGI